MGTSGPHKYSKTNTLTHTHTHTHAHTLSHTHTHSLTLTHTHTHTLTHTHTHTHTHSKSHVVICTVQQVALMHRGLNNSIMIYSHSSLCLCFDVKDPLTIIHKSLHTKHLESDHTQVFWSKILQDYECFAVL